MLPWRTYIETARNQSGRIATAAGGAGLAAGLFTGEMTAATALTTLAVTGGGLLTTSLGKHDTTTKAVAGALYAAPGTGLLAVLIAERVAEGVRLWEVAAVAIWTAGTWVLRPVRLARRLLGQHVNPIDKLAGPLPTAAPVVIEQQVEAHPLSRWWTQNVTRDIAPRTRLADPERIAPGAMRGVITSTVSGEPVPPIDIARLSARMDVPQELIAITAMPGRGAGVALLTVGTAPTALTPEQEWANIAGSALPGTTLLDVRTYPIQTAAAVSLSKEEIE